tara:strand:+ start:1501 stop:2259 length:759 start_codon:yes stop_codon:yes gene_type:complete
MKLDINRAVIIITLIMALAVFGTAIMGASSEPLPDFSVYKDVKQKKSAFFGYILPLVEAQNTLIQRKRDKLLELKLLRVDEYSRSQRNFLTDLAKEYRLTASEITPAEVKQLISRVDQVPASLALAQAAMESAWGTSRFAVQANNLFGQWCYEKGCGLVPLRRNAGSKHEVAKFDSVSDAIKSYLRNINTHRAYSDLREQRAVLRNAGKVVTGHKLAEGLIDYSELREAYVHEIQAVIRINKLTKYDSESTD